MIEIAEERLKPSPTVKASDSVSAALAVILAADAVRLESWEPICRRGQDNEGVHQCRVALRRMRSALRLFRTVLPKPVVKPWAQSLRHHASRLGDARDLDVFLDETLAMIPPSICPHERLRESLEEQHKVAYQEVQMLLDDPSYERFKEQLEQWIDAHAWLEDDELSAKKRHKLQRDILPFAQQMLDQQADKVIKRGKALCADRLDRWHKLRIECKKLRYGAEFFEPLFDGMGDYIKSLKALQSTLGTLNDLAVAEEIIKNLKESSAPSKPNKEERKRLKAWCRETQKEYMAEFAAPWTHFCDLRRPWVG